MLDAAGNLTFANAQTLLGIEKDVTTCTYHFAVIPKEGIKTINRQAFKYSSTPKWL